MEITGRERERLAEAIMRRIEEKQQVEEVAAAMIVTRCSRPPFVV